MNREEKISRLQTLLQRVQTRAAQQRFPAGSAATAKDLAGHAAPVAMPTAEPFDVEETQPFAKIPQVQQEPEFVNAAVSSPDADVEISVGSVELDLDMDDVGEGGLEIVGDAVDKAFEASEEPPASSRRPRAAAESLEIDLDEGVADAPRVTPPPESGPQQVSAEPSGPMASSSDFEVDQSPKRLTPEHPSIEMLGQTVDLPEGAKDEDPALELDRQPVVTPLRERPTGEMEAVIPGSFAPGVYPPLESDQTESPFGKEPSTNDWEIPEPSGEPPAPPPTKKPGEIALDDALDDAFEGEISAEARVAAEVQAPAPAEPKPDDEALAPPLVPEEPAVEAKASPPVPEKPTDDVQAAPSVAQEPAVVDSRELVAEDVAATAEQEQAATPPQPVRIEIAGQVVAAPDLTTDSVAKFVGAVEPTAGRTFLEALDASLALGEDSNP